MNMKINSPKSNAAKKLFTYPTYRNTYWNTIPTVHSKAQTACCALCNLSKRSPVRTPHGTMFTPPSRKEIADTYAEAVECCNVAGKEVHGPASSGVVLHERIFAGLQRTWKTYGYEVKPWNANGVVNVKDHDAINYIHPKRARIHDALVRKRTGYKFITHNLPQPIDKMPTPCCG